MLSRFIINKKFHNTTKGILERWGKFIKVLKPRGGVAICPKTCQTLCYFGQKQLETWRFRLFDRLIEKYMSRKYDQERYSSQSDSANEITVMQISCTFI